MQNIENHFLPCARHMTAVDLPQPPAGAWPVGRALAMVIGLFAAVCGVQAADSAAHRGRGAAMPSTPGAVLTPTPVTRLTLERDDTRFVGSVATGGDVNGDGYDDVIVPVEDTSGDAEVGAVLVYHGGPDGVQPSPVARLTIDAPDSEFGKGIAIVGDINADGYDDAVIGARALNGDDDSDVEGAAFVHHGSAQGLNEAPAATLTMDGGNAYFGFKIAAAGDINGDNHADVLITAANFSGERNPINSGCIDRREPVLDPPPVYRHETVFVYLGSGNGIEPEPVRRLALDQRRTGFGTKGMAGVGDLDGDGYDDVAIGADDCDSRSEDEGAVFIYGGTRSGLDREPIAHLEIDRRRATFGRSIAAAGDTNADGFGEVLVGAPGYARTAGAAFAYEGNETGIDTIPRVRLPGGGLSPDSGAKFGITTAGSADFNGDGYDDVVVGGLLLRNDAGAAVYTGGPQGLGAKAAVTLDSGIEDEILPVTTVATGDVNGDGLSDVVLRDAAFRSLDAPAVMVYHGIKGAAPPRAVGALAGAWFDPDRNGEGYLLDINKASVFLTWFTYVDGNQMWLIAQAPLPEGGITFGEPIVMDTHRPVGAAFGPRFDPDDVILQDWGEITLTFESCRRATLAYRSSTGFGSGENRMQRTVQGGLAGVSCR